MDPSGPCGARSTGVQLFGCHRGHVRLHPKPSKDRGRSRAVRAGHERTVPLHQGAQTPDGACGHRCQEIHPLPERWQVLVFMRGGRVRLQSSPGPEPSESRRRGGREGCLNHRSKHNTLRHCPRFLDTVTAGHRKHLRSRVEPDLMIGLFRGPRRGPGSAQARPCQALTWAMSRARRSRGG